MSKRFKLMIGILIGFVVVLFGAIFGLAKTGVINLKIFGDVVGTATMEIDVRNTSSKAFGEGVFATATQGTTVVATANTVNITEGGVVKSIATLTGLQPYTSYAIHLSFPPNCSADGNFSTLMAYSMVRKSLVLPCTTTPPTCGTITCSANQHCKSANVCVENCTATSCGSGQTCNSTTKECEVISTYSLTGRVMDGNLNTPLQGAKVYQADKSALTDINGKYTLSGLTTGTQSGQSFTFTKDGYTAINKTFTEINHQTPPVAPTALAEDVSLFLDTKDAQSKFNLIGKITGPDNSMLDGVQVKVSCANSCGKGPWTSGQLSSATGLTTFPNLASNYNYVVSDIYNFKNDASISGMKIEFIKNGYFYDANNNGYNDDQGTLIIIDPSSIAWSPVGPGSTYANLSRKDIKLKLPEKVTLVGKITFDQMPSKYADIKITIVGQKFENGNYIDDGTPISVTSATTPTVIDDLTAEKDINYKITDIPSHPRYKVTFKSADSSWYIPLSQETIYLDPSNLKSYNDKKYFRLDKTVGAGQNSLMVTVIDKNTNLPVPATNIKINDPVCGVIEEQATNSQGKSYFNSAKYSAYVDRSGTYAKCFHPELIAEKAGYIKQIRMFEVLDFIKYDYYPSAIDLVISLSKDNLASTTRIIGTVYSTNGSETVPKAKIKLWRGTNPTGEPTKTIYADDNGKFQFDSLLDGDYVITAYKEGYFLTNSSTSYLRLNPSEKKEISLFLEEEKSGTGVLYFPVYVLEKSLLTGIENATVSVKSDKETITAVKTDTKGRTDVYLKQGITYTIIATRGTVGATSIITVPSDYDYLTEEEKATFATKFIFIFNTGASYSPTYSSIAIKFVEEGTDTPIPGVKVINYPLSGTADFGISSKIIRMTAISKADGKVVFLADFTSANNDLARYLKQNKNLYWLSDDIWIDYFDLEGFPHHWNIEKLSDVPAADTLECVSGGQCVFKIEIAKVTPKTSGGYIIVNFIDLLGQPDIKAIAGNMMLEKYNSSTKQWVKVEVDAKNILIDDSVTYKGLPPGKYRPKITLPLIIGDEVNIIGSEMEMVIIGVCTSSKALGVFDYPNNVKLVFTDQTQFDRYKKNPEVYDQIASTIDRLKRTSIDVGPIVVVLNADSDINALTRPQTYNHCVGFDKAKSITIQEGLINYLAQTNTYWQFANITAHEYGHLVFNELKTKNIVTYLQINAFFNYIESSTANKCVFDSITDGSVFYSVRSFGGHPEDNVDEFFASFYADYFLSHERFHGVIKYHCEEKSACQNILEFVWNIFAEKIGKVYGNDNTAFPAVGGSVTSGRYSFEQIAAGVWRQDVYDSLNYIEKSKVAYSRWISPYINTTIDSVKTAITKFNNLMNQVLESLGLLGKVGNAKVSVVGLDSKPASNVIVQVGPKAGITDAYGLVTIYGIPQGIQPIVKAQQSTARVYDIVSPISKSINIITGTTTSQIIQINK